jgi:hypothetical protein
MGATKAASHDRRSHSKKGSSMSTLKQALPLAVRLGELHGRILPWLSRSALPAIPLAWRRVRGVEGLPDWILHDVGLARDDTMSPEARRALTRLTVNTLW